VPDRVAGLQARGKRVIVVSNAAGYPYALLMERYARLGYRFDPEDVVTSRKAVLRAARSRPGRSRIEVRAAGVPYMKSGA
jgi:glycerol-1-phosphatase